MASDAGSAIGPMWQQFLGQMTQAGASRRDIAQATVGTALAIMVETRTALWPDGDTVAQEAGMRLLFDEDVDHLTESLETLSG